jgi:hypothetical protein
MTVRRFVTGHSIDPSGAYAAKELVQQVQAKMGGIVPQAGLLFVSRYIDDPAAIAATITEAFPGIVLVGCSSNSELSDGFGFQESSTVFLALSNPAWRFASAVVRAISVDDPANYSGAIGAHHTDAPALCFAFPESLSLSCDRVVERIAAALHPETILVGGFAADRWQITRTYQIHGNEVLYDAAPMLFIYGDLDVGVGSASGWTPFSNTGVVTKANGNVVVAINQKPAADFYRDCFGDWPNTFGEYPLHVKANVDLYRLPLELHGDGSIAFAGDIATGSEVRICNAKAPEDLYRAVELASSQARQAMRGEPAIGLIFSCAARNYVLGRGAERELDIFRSRFGEQFAIAGFYCYGEICPPPGDRRALLRNESFTCCLIG